MAMGIRENEQSSLWIATSELPKSPGHPFYTRLNALLDAHDFDRFVEGQCRSFYAPVMGRPSLAPGRYFRLLLVGYFEGLDSERGIAWRATDSLAVRTFLRLPLDEPPPDHSTISRTRRVMELETHRAVFTWVQERLVEAGLLKGKTVAIDATTLEANAAMRSIVRRATEETYQEFLTGLAKASGIQTPTREELARLDRKRKKKTSNKEWTNPNDPDAKVAKMKDGRTHLAHKAEHAVDLETVAIVAVTLQGADQGDTTTIADTTTAAADQIEDAQADVTEPQPLEEIIADKGYHSNQTMVDLDAVDIRSYIAEPDRGRRDWSDAPDAQAPVYRNRRRIRGRRGRRLMRQRGERIERSFAHLYDTGGMRRTHLRGHTNILKRLLIHAGGFNLGLVMRHLIGVGTPRGLQGRLAAILTTLFVLLSAAPRRLTTILASHRRLAVRRSRPTSPTALVVNSSPMATCVAVGTTVNPPPPARIRTGRIAAYGSYLGCMASKRTFG
ncbi:transposase [Microbacterium sp.]|uniref:transposase n=1 Tax=Microbacterium sp. TaxID=51671 RepID=UPI002736F59A|nr:transposase [Microbacterium sp.]MDP3949596.1 transposase [Microbacterium sp.]